jgi:two-component system sensor histidine kinase KdpD
VDNALKYTPKGSKIEIYARKENQMIAISIADNGKGIADCAKEKIFDMFYTADSKVADSRRGLGLGLFLCKSIIQAHGGTIQVADNVPHGTIFTFTLQAEEVTLNE